MKKLMLTLAAMAAIISCKKEEKSVVIEDNQTDTVVVENDLNTNNKSLQLTLNSASDSNLSGTVQLDQSSDSVTMSVNIAGVTPGEHAIHIHEFGDCSASDASSAGGHWNPTGHEHGKFGMDSYHMGDIGNLVADENGNASLTFSTDKWCLSCEDENKNIVGKSIIIHESVDDFTTQPTGNAGGRIGCVVIE